MDIAHIGLQTPADNGLLPGAGQSNALADRGNPNAENASPLIPASTRVSISAEAQTRLAAEQGAAAGIQQNVAQNQETTTASLGVAPPVTPAATLADAPSTAASQGVAQATASVAPVAPEAGNGNAPALAVNAPETPETSNALRQEVERQTQQEDIRRDDTAASRQDAGPALTQGAGTTRSALAA
ncbi:MAG: hypothetical protein LBD68_03965 [Zoogloeaceae bacterium]|jgi:hypothetical protein|nr:hypothetical protein [Zoogloeaceae bacterium]